MDKQEQLNAIIAEHMKNLPPEVKDVVKSFTWLETMQSLAAAYKLNIEQQGILGTEVTMSILGIIHPDDFAHELRNGLHLGTEQTENLIVDINEKIFRPIRAKLIGVYNKNQENKAKLIAGEEDEEEIEPESDKIPLAEELAQATKPQISMPLPDIGIPMAVNTQISQTPRIIEPKIISPKAEVPPAAIPAQEPAPIQDKILQTQDVVTSELRKDVLSESMVNQKLGGIFSVSSTETDHSLNKSTGGEINNSPSQKSPDPYREVI